MASSKDTFEGKTWASNTFACGTFRGLGATVAYTLVGLWSDLEKLYADRGSVAIAADRQRVEGSADRQRTEVRS